jgi:hypothetical protein
MSMTRMPSVVDRAVRQACEVMLVPSWDWNSTFPVQPTFDMVQIAVRSSVMPLPPTRAT